MWFFILYNISVSNASDLYYAQPVNIRHLYYNRSDLLFYSVSISAYVFRLLFAQENWAKIVGLQNTFTF